MRKALNRGASTAVVSPDGPLQTRLTTDVSRRSLLRSLGATGLTAAAGCSTLDGLDDLDHQVERGDGQTTVRFVRGDRTVGNAMYLLDAPHDRWVRFKAHADQRASGISSYRLRFKPLVPQGQHVRVLLERPGGHPFPQFNFEQGEGYGWTLFEVPDLEQQTPGSFGVDFYFEMLGDDPESFDVSTEVAIEFDNGVDPRPLRGEATVMARGPNR